MGTVLVAADSGIEPQNRRGICATGRKAASINIPAILQADGRSLAPYDGKTTIARAADRWVGAQRIESIVDAELRPERGAERAIEASIDMNPISPLHKLDTGHASIFTYPRDDDVSVGQGG